MAERRKPLVIVFRKLPDLVETRMMELFDTRLNVDDRPLSPDAMEDAFRNADVVVPTVTDRVDAGLIAGAGNRLKLIANFGAGVDHIDLDAARTRGIAVTNTPGVLTEDTADMVLALILAAARRVVEGDALTRSGQWEGWSPTSMLGQRLAGKRLGILGMGRIGQAVARRAKGFGLSIHYHNRRRVPAEIEAKLEATYWESLDQMLARMDIVSINCPRTPATYHLLSARRLALMPRHAILVNTARGDVIDEKAMTQLLAQGDLGAAGLDVYENEPAIGRKLLSLSNVVLLPHMGSATLESRIDMGEKVIVNIRAFVDGHAPPDRVLATEF
ncbi:MAG: 2-hydroxyacid dehydrogenase [Inquilinaceae bacterium]